MAATTTETLYSRQLYVVGEHGQSQLASSNILIVGVDSVAAEIGE